MQNVEHGMRNVERRTRNIERGTHGAEQFKKIKNDNQPDTRQYN